LPPPQTLDRNYTNDLLEVIDGKGNVVIQVRIQEDRIKLNGIFYDSDGNGVAFAPNYKDLKWSVFSGLNPNKQKPDIEPIFKYPSELHLGEYSSSRLKEADYWFSQGIQYTDSNKYQKALQCYENAISVNISHVNAWTNKAYILFLQKKYGQTIEWINKKSNFLNDNAYAWNIKGDV
jgi:tetratricopeptide (TPR) repeat protein